MKTHRKCHGATKRRVRRSERGEKEMGEERGDRKGVGPKRVQFMV